MQEILAIRGHDINLDELISEAIATLHSISDVVCFARMW